MNINTNLLVIAAVAVGVGVLVNSQLIDSSIANRVIDLMLGGVGGAALVRGTAARREDG